MPRQMRLHGRSLAFLRRFVAPGLIVVAATACSVYEGDPSERARAGGAAGSGGTGSGATGGAPGSGGTGSSATGGGGTSAGSGGEGGTKIADAGTDLDGYPGDLPPADGRMEGAGDALDGGFATD